jgi:hypothetical protein
MKQVLLIEHNIWADVEQEDDEWIIATNPVDGIITYVSKLWPYQVRENSPESHGEPH